MLNTLVLILLLQATPWPTATPEVLAKTGDVKSNPGSDRGVKPSCWKQKNFFITFWSPPPADDNALTAVAAEHYNLTWVPEEGLDGAARHGLRRC